MSQDLLTQLREYGEYQHKMRQPVAVEDLERLVDHRMVPMRPSRPNGPFIAIAVLVGVILLIGGAAFLFSGSGEEQPADSVVLTTPPESAPTTAVDSTPTTAATVPETPTTIAESATSNSGVIAETLEMLDIALEQEEVHDSKGPADTRARLEYVYSYLTGIEESAGWPEPTFDTSLLGVESVLTEVDPDPSLLGFVSGPPSASRGGVLMAPFVAAAQLEGATADAVFNIVLAFRDDIVDVEWRLGSQHQGSPLQLGSQYGDIGLPPSIIIVHGPRSGIDEAATIGGLPLEASVVTTTFSDGTKVWQRPISGIAIFDDPNKQCVPVSEGDFCEFEYTVFDANGNEILRIVSDPGPGPGYRLDSP